MSKLKDFLETALRFPKEIHLESSSRCNAKCIMCPREGMKRYQGEMDRDIFIKAVDECIFEHMEYIHFHLNGEPLLLDIDELCWRIKYARSTNPDKKLVFFTNGCLLTKDRVDKICETGLDILVISIDGGTAEDYERVRVGLKFETVKENVRYLVEHRNATNTKMKLQTAIVPQEANKNSIDLYHKIFQDIGVDDVGGSGVQNIGGLIDSNSMIIHKNQYMSGNINAPCWRVFGDLSITADGKAVVCCQDVQARHVIGDIKTQTIKEIWHGDAMTEVRDKFAMGQKHEIKVCAECDFMRSFVEPDFWRDKDNFRKEYFEVKQEIYEYTCA